MRKGDKIFVYGSLRKGEGADLSIRSGAAFLCMDKINGRLYAPSWFPGVKLGESNNYDPSEPAVTGEVYEITDDAICRQLDSYEGYPHLFNRSEVETERSHLVWVYTYNPSVGDNQLVVTGDWLNREFQGVAA